jgi:hypothetical protein
MNRLLLIVALLAMAAWMGCDRSTSLTGSDGSKVTLTKEPEGAEVSVRGRTGESATMGLGMEVALPAGFPPDLAYPGAKVSKTAYRRPPTSRALTCPRRSQTSTRRS